MNKISINGKLYSKRIGCPIALKLIDIFKIIFIKIPAGLLSRHRQIIIKLIWSNSPSKNGKKAPEKRRMWRD